MNTPTKNRMAVFIDAENVTNWIKQNGIQFLLDELKPLGQIVIRRAYGVWSRPQLAMHQAAINKQGFELIHCYHPVTGKNTADIQMTVDVIECAWQLPNINCFVLVTGDSDFSPVFRRLREMDKEVIGVGRHSALSECVKTSCSRFIYTDKTVDNNAPRQHAPAESAMVTNTATAVAEDKNLALQRAWATAKQLIIAESEAANTSKIKTLLLIKDPAFNEKKLGFSNFTDFLKAIEGVTVYKVDTVNYVNLKPSPSTLRNSDIFDTVEDYLDLLDKHNFRLIDGDLLKAIYQQAASNKVAYSEVAALKEAVFLARHKLDERLSKPDVNKAFNFFMRLDLVHTEQTTNEAKVVKVQKIAMKDFLLRVDQLTIGMLMDLRKVAPIELKVKELKKLTLSTISQDNIGKLIGEN